MLLVWRLGVTQRHMTFTSEPRGMAIDELLDVIDQSSWAKDQ